jgi:hypothetical protein
MGFELSHRTIKRLRLARRLLAAVMALIAIAAMVIHRSGGFHADGRHLRTQAPAAVR